VRGERVNEEGQKGMVDLPLLAGLGEGVVVCTLPLELARQSF
jgi:hypothetical protein